MEINTLKNNELITGISILAVLRFAKHMQLSKCMLVEPLLSYSKVLSALGRSNSSIKSIEDLIIKECITFSNFNERYKEKMALSINSILLFEQLNLLKMHDEEIYFAGERFDFNNASLGNTAKSRIAASERLNSILTKGVTSDLYLSLRVEL